MMAIFVGFFVSSDSCFKQSPQRLGASIRIVILFVLFGFVRRQHCSHQIQPQRALSNLSIIQRINSCHCVICRFHDGDNKVKFIWRVTNPLCRVLAADPCDIVVHPSSRNYSRSVRSVPITQIHGNSDFVLAVDIEFVFCANVTRRMRLW